jgi:hypothetical protein
MTATMSHFLFFQFMIAFGETIKVPLRLCWARAESAHYPTYTDEAESQ